MLAKWKIKLEEWTERKIRTWATAANDKYAAMFATQDPFTGKIVFYSIKGYKK